MLFSDEERFHKSYVNSQVDKQVMGVKNFATEEHIGPGSYFQNDLEEKRNGWGNRSFNRRQPMTPGKLATNSPRHNHGVLTPYGAIAAPPSPHHTANTGPGYYNTSSFNSFSSSPNSPNRSFRVRSDISLGGASTGTTNMPSTPRFAFDQSAVVKDGVLFVSAENNRKDIGPGYYSFNTDTLNKSSFNVRAKSANRSSIRKPVAQSPGYSNSMDNSRPRSSSSGRFRI